MRNEEKNMSADNAIKILENAPGKDFYTVEYQDAFSIAIDALREVAKAEADAKKKNLAGTREHITGQEAIKLLTKYVDNELCYSLPFKHAIELAIDVLREKTYPTAHWIFSGDEDDYDGYYINCSKCGTQRKAYDRNCDLDIPVACPYCGVAIDVNAWKVQDIVKDDGFDDERMYRVTVIHDNGNVKRSYIMNVMARREDHAREKALYEVTFNQLHKSHYDSSVYVGDVTEV